MSPVLYEAIRDLLLETPLTILGASSAAAVARHRLHQWLVENPGETHNQQRRELRLYRLAKETVPWNRNRKAHPPSGKLSFLADKMAPENTWATFTAFAEAWKDLGTLHLEKWLPRLHEIGETRNPSDDEESDAVKLIKATHRLETTLHEVSDLLRRSHVEIEVTHLELANGLRALKNHAIANRTALEPMKIQLADVEKRDRLRMVLFLLLALLMVALLFINPY